MGLGSSLRRSSICTAGTGRRTKSCRYPLYRLGRLSSVTLPTSLFSIGAPLVSGARTILLDCGRICWYSTAATIFPVEVAATNSNRVENWMNLIIHRGAPDPEHLVLRTQHVMWWKRTQIPDLVEPTSQHPPNQPSHSKTSPMPRTNTIHQTPLHIRPQTLPQTAQTAAPPPTTLIPKRSPPSQTSSKPTAGSKPSPPSISPPTQPGTTKSPTSP